MISLDELKRIAKLKGINNLGNAEKDYLIEIALLSISRNTKDELVFKGGTCLAKFYKLARFSQDIDFTLKNDLDLDVLIGKVILDFSSFGIEAEIKDKKKVHDSFMFTLRLKGPLYTGTTLSLSSLRIDINMKSSIDMPFFVNNFISIYPDIPQFSLQIMHEKEILAEKVRAIMKRVKARDIYDLWFLLERGVVFDEKLVEKKLEYYKEKWSKIEFTKRLNAQKNNWMIELRSLLESVPNFNDVKKSIVEKIPK